jgi:hypothetical protein
MEIDEQRLDGNAAAGLLQELFPFEMTTALTICGACGTPRQIGALMVYRHGMGTIIRCPGCDHPQIRIAHGPDRYWLDLSGIRSLQIDAPEIRMKDE